MSSFFCFVVACKIKHLCPNLHSEHDTGTVDSLRSHVKYVNPSPEVFCILEKHLHII